MQLLNALLGLMQTHIKLFGMECQEAVERLLVWLIWMVTAVAFTILALVCASFLMLILFEPHRVAVISVLCVMYSTVAGWLWLRLRSAVHQQTLPFSTLMAELRRDQQLLLGETEDNQ